MNKIILDNRQAINQYLLSLRAVTNDCTENLKIYYDEFAVNWNDARFQFTFQEFSKQIQDALDVNLQSIFDKYTKIFNRSVVLQEDEVFKLFNYFVDS